MKKFFKISIKQSVIEYLKSRITNPRWTAKKTYMNRLSFFTAIIGLTTIISCNTNTKQNQEIMRSNNKIEFINPEGLHKSPAFSQSIVVSGAAKTIYVGGQNSVDSSGAVVGKGDFKAQVEKTLKNLQLALEGAGAKPENVVKWNIYVVEGQSFQQGFEVFQSVWGKQSNPPVITGIYVAGLTNPDYLVEIDAIAVVPEK